MKILHSFSLLLLINMILINSVSAQSGWETLAPHPNPPGVAAMASVNGKIYILSGSGSALGAQANTYMYDPETNEWSQKAKIPQACYWATANASNGKIYVMGGGHPYPGKSYNFIYDPINDSWSTGDTLLTPRMYHSSAELNGKIYLIGGQNGSPVEYYFDEYDTQTNQWTRKENNLHNMAWYCSLASLGNKIYRIGGGGAPNSVTTYFECFDTENNSWTQLPDMKTKFHASVALTHNNKMYLIGGNANGIDSDTIFGYYPGIEEWVPELIKLPQPRVYHRGVICDDYIYIYGGQNTQSDPIEGTLIRMHLGGSDVKINENEQNIRIFPNPSNGIFYIDLNSSLSLQCDIKLFDLFGNIIDCKIEPGSENQIVVTTNNIEKGLYFVKISNSNFVKVLKVIIN